MSLFEFRPVRLHGGEISNWKINCDSLTPEDDETLAYLAQQLVPQFGEVLGVPRGGEALARALRMYQEPVKGYLIVDDVLTTGSSMEDVKHVVIQGGEAAEEDIFGLVIFARGKCPDWVTPIFQMTL